MNMFRKNRSSERDFVAFPYKIISGVLANSCNKNVLVSPVRIMSILAFLSRFTDNETKTRIAKVIGLSDESLHVLSGDLWLPSNSYFPWSSEEYKRQIMIEKSSSVWINSNIPTSDYFDTVTKEWNFEKVALSLSTDETKQRIKEYVKKHTHGMITNLNVDLPEIVKAVLVDCIYFKGKWRFTFDSSDTEPDIFHSITSDETVPFMKVRLIHGYYYTCRTFYAVSLDYRCYCEDRSYSMRIYLPKNGKSCADVLRIIQERGSGIEFREKPISLCMPRFQISKQTDLFCVLKDMNLDISKMPINISNDKKEKLIISEMIQQGSLKVTEKGTEVGMATYSRCFMGTFRVRYKEIKVNRPFVFEIVENYSGIRIFAGVVNKI